MIVILYPDGRQGACKDLAAALNDAFRGQVTINLASASSPIPWPADLEWDDLLIVTYDKSPYPPEGNRYVSDYLNSRRGGLVLPVALDPNHPKPPASAGEIKSFVLDADSQEIDGRLVRRIGAMLGLRVQQRDNEIFISYRAADGTEIAKQLQGRLASLGYPVWRDEAREIDGLTKILPGSRVQVQIDEALERASIVLLLDTPKAPESTWIRHEIETANGQLLPILPICLRAAGDPRKGPRFRSLADLGRWVPVTLSEPNSAPPLSEDDISRIVGELESFLCEVFQRKCRVPFIVEQEFISRAFSWRMLDKKLLMGEATKKHSIRAQTRVLSHCSIFDYVHGPAMTAFSGFLKGAGRANFALYIYDGELIPELELEDIIAEVPGEDNVMILHHQELAALIESNFSKFS